MKKVCLLLLAGSLLLSCESDKDVNPQPSDRITNAEMVLGQPASFKYQVIQKQVFGFRIANQQQAPTQYRFKIRVLFPNNYDESESLTIGQGFTNLLSYQQFQKFTFNTDYFILEPGQKYRVQLMDMKFNVIGDYPIEQVTQ